MLVCKSLQNLKVESIWPSLDLYQATDFLLSWDFDGFGKDANIKKIDYDSDKKASESRY